MATSEKKRELESPEVDLFFLSHFRSLALPFVANFAAGAIAGVSEILTFYPLGEPPHT